MTTPVDPVVRAKLADWLERQAAGNDGYVLSDWEAVADAMLRLPSSAEDGAVE